MYTVKDILKEKGSSCWTVTPTMTVFDALKLMAGKNIGAVLVVDKAKIVGIFSERDYARKIALRGKTSRDSLIGEMMSERIFFVKPETRTSECMQLMTDHRVRHLPVLDNNKLSGIVSIGDIVNKTIQDQGQTIQQLEDYIVGKRLP